jgi:predicted acetyltransferase
MPASKLVRPDTLYKNSYLEALQEYHREGRFTYLGVASLRHDFDRYIEKLRQDKGQPHQPCQDWVELVPETVLWLVKDREYIGSVDIRHRINWHLEKWGGHIHFVIRPGMRGKRYGRKALQKAIPFANYLGIDQALLTVAPDNTPAIRIIEHCGGVFSDRTQITDRFPARLRYWLDCS